jgi:hypothetical protein
MSTGTVSNWMILNPITSTIGPGQWNCGPTDGRSGTPGIKCTGTYGSAFHLDTSYLITPALNLSGYTGNIYLQFDTKTSDIILGDTIEVMAIHDTTHPESGASYLSPALAPVFTNGDATDWVTHVANLTAFKSTPFFIAFRYTSPSTSGNIWYLDNVNTTTLPITLGLPTVERSKISVLVAGPAGPSDIKLNCDAPVAGTYQVVLTDMPGRAVYNNTMTLSAGFTEFDIKGLNLAPGMYFLKLGNGQYLGTAKVMIQ